MQFLRHGSVLCRFDPDQLGSTGRCWNAPEADDDHRRSDWPRAPASGSGDRDLTAVPSRMQACADSGDRHRRPSNPLPLVTDASVHCSEASDGRGQGVIFAMSQGIWWRNPPSPPRNSSDIATLRRAPAGCPVEGMGRWRPPAIRRRGYAWRRMSRDGCRRARQRSGRRIWPPSGCSPYCPRA